MLQYIVNIQLYMINTLEIPNISHLEKDTCYAPARQHMMVQLFDLTCPSTRVARESTAYRQLYDNLHSGCFTPVDYGNRQNMVIQHNRLEKFCGCYALPLPTTYVLNR